MIEKLDYIDTAGMLDRINQLIEASNRQDRLLAMLYRDGFEQYLPKEDVDYWENTRRG